ncbi:hypothetical protein [Streptomyces sp. NPDC088762]|uniref:hypothetical protein n=1 Tax=Streptomyces sp. NPDC088762 TaxID=3365891 RepID=UPI0037F86EE8
MIIAAFVFLIVGLFVVVTPGAVLGCVFALVSGRLPHVARIPLLVLLAGGSAALWLAVIGPNLWRPAIVVLSFTATLVSGATFLMREARKRRAPQIPPWPAWYPPAGPR